MFYIKVGQATKAKKAVYLAASIILGLLLSFNLGAAIEVNYLNCVSSRESFLGTSGACSLLPALWIIILLLGALAGLFFGRYWWRKIYIERCWQKKKK